MKLSDSYHKNQTFENLMYMDEHIAESTFDGCTFLRCNMQQTLFEECTFNNCVFDGCDLSLIKFKLTTFNNVNINNSKAIGILWHQCSNPLRVSFSNSQVNYSSFYGKAPRKLSIVNCQAIETDFTSAQLSGADFEGTDLSGARFSGTDLTKATFANAHDYDIDPLNNKIKGAKFSMPEALSLLTHLGIEIID